MATLLQRAGWRTWASVGLISIFALLGLVAGVSGALLLGGLAAALVGTIGLVRPSWTGTGSRRMAGALVTAGMAGLLGGTVVAPAVPVAVPPPAATSTRTSAPPPTPEHATATQAPTGPTTPSRSATAVPSRPAPSTPPPAPGTALATLNHLPVKGRAPKTGYDRDRFGDGWATRPDGCTTRQAVLRRDLADVRILAADECIVLGGKLDDPYTGTTFTAKTTGFDDLAVDHVVALSDAWQKGARRWSRAEREAFANDLLNLQTTQSRVNASKGDGDAATWLPPNTRYRCSYVARQIAVKDAYRLSVTQSEKAAMRRVLAKCPQQRTPSRAAARKAVDKHPTVVTPTKPNTDRKKAARTDPRFPTCKAANAAGYGPYYSGRDPEYGWYRDNDHDGVVCER
ncbi:GmrSD restriction endonuclease domain-containing protein [Microlunatus ginsengisoli]|uniref:GmrSD restriction endonuclease domain-containing protein n=1 Tax=Microlunatus ginsengisoli TaxID=363863 RepID=UPI0031D65853